MDSDAIFTNPLLMEYLAVPTNQTKHLEQKLKQLRQDVTSEESLAILLAIQSHITNLNTCVDLTYLIYLKAKLLQIYIPFETSKFSTPTVPSEAIQEIDQAFCDIFYLLDQNNPWITYSLEEIALATIEHKDKRLSAFAVAYFAQASMVSKDSASVSFWLNKMMRHLSRFESQASIVNTLGMIDDYIAEKNDPIDTSWIGKVKIKIPLKEKPNPVASNECKQKQAASSHRAKKSCLIM